jgi:hypothetical protein
VQVFLFAGLDSCAKFFCTRRTFSRNICVVFKFDHLLGALFLLVFGSEEFSYFFRCCMISGCPLSFLSMFGCTCTLLRVLFMNAFSRDSNSLFEDQQLSGSHV